MNGYQRVVKTLRFEKTDRAALIPEIIQHNLDIAGENHRNFSSDPEIMCKVILAGLQKYETDAVYVSSDNYLIAEAMGGQVLLPIDEPPRLLKTPAATIEEAVALPPLHITDGRIPVILEATRKLRAILQNEVFVKTCIDSAPFSAAASILGPEKFMLSLIDEPELCHILIENCVESVVRYGIAAAEAGAHGLAFGDSAAVLINRDMYQAFVLPYAKKAIGELKRRTGLPVFYHICGNASHILDLMAETGADCLEIDSMVSMAEAKAVVNGKCVLEGNVRTIEAFLMGTPDDVRRETNAILDLFGNSGGVIISSACVIPRHSPSENVRALTDAVQQYRFPNTI